MLVSLSEASRLTGKSKSVISNALKKGVMSYVSKDLTGYKIDTSELFRVFSQRTEEPVLEPLERTIQNPSKNGHENELIEYKMKVMEEKIEEFKKREEGWEREKTRLEHQIEAWMKQAEAKTRLLEAPQENPITTTQTHDEEPKQTEQEQLPQETVPMEDVSKVYPSTQIMPNNIVENSNFIDDSKIKPKFDINMYLMG